ncbi:hypothetical protein M3Y99_00559200 [Aphelenchoides fujianensis]|nr:hypothetical protein M3Y99_00559200 [Aphelenchoides fujianensis]
MMSGHNGETVRLECSFDCHSSTKITWNKNVSILRESSEYKMSFDGRVATLQIHNFNQTKAGTYECVAKRKTEVAEESRKKEEEDRRKEEIRKRAQDRKRAEEEKKAEEQRAAEERKKQKEEGAQKRKTTTFADQEVPEKKAEVLQRPRKSLEIKVPDVEDSPTVCTSE